MLLLQYPVRIRPDGDRYTVTFQDIPTASARGMTIEYAMDRARDVLKAVLQVNLDRGKPIPAPSKAAPYQHTVDFTLKG